MGQGKSRVPLVNYKVLRKSGAKHLKHGSYDVNILLNSDEYENVTPLWLSARYGDIEFAKALISLGADPNKKCGGLSMTPLHMAAYNHDTSIVSLLLNKGADPNILDRWNYTPLMYVAIHYEAFLVNELFELLIANGADVNYGAVMNKDGSLDENERKKFTIELQALRSGYDSDYITYVREPMGATSGAPLHLAVQNPHLPNETVEILLNSKADLNIANLHKQTPLMGVMMDTYYDYHSNVKSHAELLIEKGASVNAQDIRGWNSIHYAAQRGSIPCMELLLKADVDCDATSNVGETPLWILLALGWRDGASYLIRSGCDIDIPAMSTTILAINQANDLCRYGTISPIEFAVCNKFYNVAELLVRAGCKIDDSTWLGGSLVPANARHTKFVDFLDKYLSQAKALRPLRDISRQCIRNSIKRGICVKIKSIPIPSALKEYVCLSDEFGIL